MLSLLLSISAGESVFQLVIVLVIFVAVLFVTYYTTKWLSGYMKAQSFNKNLRIVETLKLTTNKYVQIIKAGRDAYYVIAIGKDEVTLLGTLTKEELLEEDVSFQGTAGGGTDFSELFSRMKERLPKR